MDRVLTQKFRALPVVLPLLLLAAAPATAQGVHGEPVDLAFRVENVTTGEPGTLERIVVSYLMIMPEVVIDTEPVGASFVLEEVPVKPEGRYIVEAWTTGVPYYFSLKGRELRDGETVLHVFDTTREREDVAVAGLNVVARREGDVLRLEYLLQVRNDRRPQATVFSPQGSLALVLPPGASDVAAEYHRATRPTTVPVRPAGDDAWALVLPLVSGMNRARVTAQVAWREDLAFDVGADLPVEAWSLLVTPDWIEVDSRQLEPVRDAGGVRRLAGPPLAADERLEVRLRSGTGAAEITTNLFEDGPAETTFARAADEDEGGGLPVPILGAALVLIVVLAVVLARRRA